MFLSQLNTVFWISFIIPAPPQKKVFILMNLKELEIQHSMQRFWEWIQEAERWGLKEFEKCVATYRN